MLQMAVADNCSRLPWQSKYLNQCRTQVIHSRNFQQGWQASYCLLFRLILSSIRIELQCRCQTWKAVGRKWMALFALLSRDYATLHLPSLPSPKAITLSTCRRWWYVINIESLSHVTSSIGKYVASTAFVQFVAWGGPTRFCTPTRSNQSYSRSSCAGPYKLHWGVRIGILSSLKMTKLSTTMYRYAMPNITRRNTRVANGNLWVPWKVQEGACNPWILRSRGAKVHVSLTHCIKYSHHTRLDGIQHKSGKVMFWCLVQVTYSSDELLVACGGNGCLMHPAFEKVVPS